MDELISEFVNECHEGLARIDAELVAFERDPSERERLSEIFRVVHTIKGTSGFLGLARLERLAHATESLLGAWRDARCTPSTEGVNAVLAALDSIKQIVAGLEHLGTEPEGDDSHLIAVLQELAGEPAARSRPREAAAKTAARERTSLESSAEVERREYGKCEPAAAAPPMASPVAETDAVQPRAGGGAEKTLPASSQRSARAGSLRVSVALLESLMGHVSDLVLTRNRLVRLGRELGHPELESALQRLDQVTTELRDGIMKARMQPISNAWSGVPRIVRDLCASLGKRVELVMEGGATELDRQLLEQLRDPLTHIVRNAIDHGIEPPEERKRLGKPETGLLKLSAAHEGGMIVVRIADDGRGLNLERIGQKAVAAGLCSAEALASMSPRQIANFIFAPGLSTAETVTKVSGRGVGMDVVRRNIDDIGGSVEIETWPGKGTMFTITIPLTLAIVPALIVSVSEQKFALPQQGILEIVRCGRDDDRRLEVVDGRCILRLRGEFLPVRSLAAILGLAEKRETAAEQGFILVLEPGGHRFGLLVDAVQDSEEIVVEPIAGILRNITLFAGTTLLGDGSIAIVLDLKSLAAAVGGNDRMALARDLTTKPAADSESTQVLRFAAGPFRRAAVPIALVERIERIDPRQLEAVGTRSVFRYGKELVPVVDIEASPIAALDAARPALLFADAGRRFALVVDEIFDVVETKIDLTIDPDAPTILGAGYVVDSSCVLLDVGHFVTAIFGGWFGAEKAARAQQNLRLLLIDDSRFFRSLLAPILASRGYSVVAVESARQALAQLEQGEHYDVIVSDLEMPDMDGLTFAEACRARGMTIPLIALTSRTTPEDRLRSRAAGFDEHVSKLDRQHLFAALSRLVTPRAAVG